MSAYARDRQRRGWDDRDPPPGGRRGRLPEVHRFCLSSPPPKRNADRPCAFGCELKAAGGRHRKAGKLADDGAEPAMAKAFLHAGEYGLVVAGLDVDHPVGDEPRLCDRRREQIGSRNAPEDLALGAGGDARAEQGGCRSVDRAIPPARDLMQRAEGKPASRKARIDVGDPERKRRTRALRTPLDPLDLGAQRVYGGLRPHVFRLPPWTARTMSFAICSNLVRRESRAVARCPGSLARLATMKRSGACSLKRLRRRQRWA